MTPVPKIPLPLYECANEDDCVYPRDVFGGYVESKKKWFCVFCIEDNLGVRLTEDEMDIEWQEEATWPEDLLPDPFFSCADEDCASEYSWPAEKLNLHELEGKFFCHGCPSYQTFDEDKADIDEDYGPMITLADVLKNGWGGLQVCTECWQLKKRLMTGDYRDEEAFICIECDHKRALNYRAYLIATAQTAPIDDEDLKKSVERYHTERRGR